MLCQRVPVHVVSCVGVEFENGVSVFDPKDSADTPKVGGKKPTAAQKRKMEAEAKARAAAEDLPDIDEEAANQVDPNTSPGTPEFTTTQQPNIGQYQGQGHSAFPGPNPGPYITPSKNPDVQVPAPSPQPGPSGLQQTSHPNDQPGPSGIKAATWVNL